jgi:hypothetical protein
MKDTYFLRLRRLVPGLLVVVGWHTFVAGNTLTGIPLFVKLLLLSSARTLP